MCCKSTAITEVVVRALSAGFMKKKELDLQKYSKTVRDCSGRIRSNCVTLKEYRFILDMRKKFFN